MEKQKKPWKATKILRETKKKQKVKKNTRRQTRPRKAKHKAGMHRKTHPQKRPRRQTQNHRRLTKRPEGNKTCILIKETQRVKDGPCMQNMLGMNASESKNNFRRTPKQRKAIGTAEIQPFANEFPTLASIHKKTIRTFCDGACVHHLSRMVAHARESPVRA